MENLEVGEYTFKLDVTDASRQTTTGFIKVIVKEGIPQLVPLTRIRHKGCNINIRIFLSLLFEAGGSWLPLFILAMNARAIMMIR